MKFKVLRNSETGKKIAQVEANASKAHKEAKALAKEIGFHQWRAGYWCAFGGICCVFFKEKPDPKIWKKQEDGYYPKANSKAGKELVEKFQGLTAVSIGELNESVGFDESHFKNIGINFNNKDWFGFHVGDDWDYTPPKDCIEITSTEYKKLFP